MSEHKLKTWPGFFADIEAGVKTFEIRLNDRAYMPDDVLILREWEPVAAEYTGRECRRKVGYILYGGQFGLTKGYVAMALHEVSS